MSRNDNYLRGQGRSLGNFNSRPTSNNNVCRDSDGPYDCATGKRIDWGFNMSDYISGYGGGKRYAKSYKTQNKSAKRVKSARRTKARGSRRHRK